MNMKPIITIAFVLPLLSGTLVAEQSYLLHSTRTEGEVDRVQVLLEVGGQMTATSGGKQHKSKLNVVCDLAYHEKTLEAVAKQKSPEEDEDSAPDTRSVRYYDKAEAAVRTENAELKPKLRVKRRLVVAELNSDGSVLFSPEGPLSRAELELIDVQGNTMLLDRLLPGQSVSVGDKWQLSDDLLATLLGPDTVAESDVYCTLTEVTDEVARMEIGGKLQGTCDGAATKMEIKGKYRFDRRMKRIDWFALLVKESRQSNALTNGLEVIARVQVRVKPGAACEELSAASLEDISLDAGPASRLLKYEPSDESWQCAHDRRWIVTGESPNITAMRMVDHGDVLARCGISPLPKGKPEEIVSLEEFQADIERGLGESFGEFVSAGVRMNSENYRVYRVVVSGQARAMVEVADKKDGKTKAEEQTVPIQWRYYLVAERGGRRLVFVFSMEEALADRFGGEDLKLVDSLVFAEAGQGSEDDEVALTSEKTTEKRNGTNR